MDNNQSILLIEDDLVDVMTLKRAFKELSFDNPLHVQSNGEEGLKYLQQADELPSVILLDINMPRMNGIEFLKQIKNNNKLCKIPVVMLTTSNDHHDKQSSFKNGAAGYMIKPVDYDRFLNIVDSIKTYWSYSELPN